MQKIVKIREGILKWAIAESELNEDFVFSKLNFLQNEDGFYNITYKQLIQLSGLLKIGVGYLLLSEVPSPTRFLADFRTIGNKKNNCFSKDLKDLLLEMDFRKNWMSEYRQENEYNEFQFDSYLNLSLPIYENVNILRSILGIKENWFLHLENSKSHYEYLKTKIESIGILVMESGIVGQNTKRTLNVNEFRGFALHDKYAPLIFINSNDKIEAKNFTLIHELIHILSGSDDDILLSTEFFVESNINKITAEFLMPLSLVKLYLQNKSEALNIDYISKMAKYFGVSLFSLSYRLFQLRIINKAFFDEISEAINNCINNKKSGGNFYANYLLKTSSTFSKAVIDSVLTNRITYTDGYSLLGIRGNTFSSIEGALYAK